MPGSLEFVYQFHKETDAISVCGYMRLDIREVVGNMAGSGDGWVVGWIGKFSEGHP